MLIFGYGNAVQCCVGPYSWDTSGESLLRASVQDFNLEKKNGPAICISMKSGEPYFSSKSRTNCGRLNLAFVYEIWPSNLSQALFPPKRDTIPRVGWDKQTPFHPATDWGTLGKDALLSLLFPEVQICNLDWNFILRLQDCSAMPSLRAIFRVHFGINSTYM